MYDLTMKMLSLPAVLLTATMCFSTAAYAQRIAVLSGSYLQVMEGETSDARAEIVADRVCKTIRTSGLECVRVNGKCSDEACLKERADALSTDEAVLVSVEQTGAEYEFHLLSAQDRGAMTEHTGTLDDALAELDRLVDASVISPLEQPPETAPLPIPAASPSIEGPSENTGTPTNADRPRRIRPPVFWSVFGVAIASVAAATALEVVGYRQWQDFKDLPSSERSADKKDRLESLRIADRVMLGVSGAAVVATVVTAAFTDFKHRRVHAALTPISGGGALHLSAEF